jgi:broad specificity phosphatase PhoE
LSPGRDNDQSHAHHTPRQNRTVVYLVRHGITEWNLQKRFQGHLDVHLSPEGLDQAHRVAAWLAGLNVSFAGLYSSDLSRAAQTAATIGDALGLRPQFSAELREIFCGSWQGLSVDEVEMHYPGRLAEWRETVDRFTLPGGECVLDVQKRTFAYYKRVLGRHRGEAVILVSHGVALAALQSAIFGWDIIETWKTGRARMGNTGVTAFEVDHSTGKVETIVSNSSAHLAAPTGMSSVMDQSA